MTTERRDPRHRVILPARLRTGGFPIDMCIRDISARGLCAVAARAPERGTIVEVVDLPVPVIGTVVWTDELRFGIKLRGRIDPAALLAARSDAPEFLEQVSRPAYAQGTREIQRTADKSRRLSSIIQFLLLTIGAGSGAVAAAGSAHHLLSVPTQIIGSILDRHH